MEQETSEYDFQELQPHPEPDWGDGMILDPLGWLRGAPIVEVDRVEKVYGKNRSVLTTVIQCPICGNEHRHGFDGNGGYPVRSISTRLSAPSHRKAHCGMGSPAPDAYWLIYTINTDGVVRENGNWVWDEE